MRMIHLLGCVYHSSRILSDAPHADGAIEREESINLLRNFFAEISVVKNLEEHSQSQFAEYC